MASTVSPAEVQDYLESVSYPCTKQELIDAAQNERADKDVLDLLEQFPDKEYNSPIDVNQEIGNAEQRA